MSAASQSFGRRLERVEARVGEAADDPHLLDRGAVDLLDLADEDGEQLDVAEPHRELVDDDALAALEHVDADDVAAHRTDPGGHETERTGPVREPDAHEDARCLTHRHHLTDYCKSSGLRRCERNAPGV